MFTPSCFSVASELQNWLLFYSIPVLEGILPQRFYLHYCQLVLGISLMLGRDITDEVLLVADNAIVDFCKRLEELYGTFGFLLCSLVNCVFL